MSIEVDWNTITSGEEGAALAETVRSFIHDRFQSMPLPKLIRSLKCQSFDFGTVAPDLEIKDVCDPLPEFYEREDDDDEDDANTEGQQSQDDEDVFNDSLSRAAHASAPDQNRSTTTGILQGSPTAHRGSTFPLSGLQTDQRPWSTQQGSSVESPNPLLSKVTTPGIPGGTSNINNYFHLPLSAGLSGSARPFAAMAGGHGWPGSEAGHSNYFSGVTSDNRGALSGPVLAPHGYDQHQRRTSLLRQSNGLIPDELSTLKSPGSQSDDPERSVNDVQIVARLRYSGDIKMSLTAEINLDYPMQSFVGIPLQLNVTGLTFDGVAIIAYIQRKMHFCFLAPEDAEALVGGDSGEPPLSPPESPFASRKQASSNPQGADQGGESKRERMGSLFEEIKVESEIGQRNEGKQLLKNVGKVEKFVLEQVRNIFETELVFPSFWTFLV